MDGNGTLTCLLTTPDAEDGITFTNPLNHGDAAIAKTVAGSDEGSAFTFTVQLTAEKGLEKAVYGQTYTVEGCAAARSIAIDATGKGTIKVKGGETAVIKDLLAGTAIQVAESNTLPAKAYLLTTDEPVSETVTADETVTLAFTNTRKVGSWTLAKTVSGNAGDASKAFTFQVMLERDLSDPYAAKLTDEAYFGHAFAASGSQGQPASVTFTKG